MEITYLPQTLESKKNDVQSQLAAARQAMQDAQRAQAELDREIREHFTK